MGVVGQQPGIEALRAARQVVERRQIAIHGEDAVGGDQRVVLAGRGAPPRSASAWSDVVVAIEAARRRREAWRRHRCRRATIRRPATGRRPDQRGNNAGIGEIARAEHAGGLGPFDPRQPASSSRIKRMVAGDQARGAGAGAIALHRRDRRRVHVRMMAEVEIIVAGKRQQPAAVALDPDAVPCRGRPASGEAALAPARASFSPAKSSSERMLCPACVGKRQRDLGPGQGRNATLGRESAECRAKPAKTGPKRPTGCRALRHVWLPYAQMKTAPPPLAVARTDGSRIMLAGRARADRRHRLVVDGLPRLQPSAYPRGGEAPAGAHAACDVRRPGARAGLTAGRAARGPAARAISTTSSSPIPARSRSRSR